MTVTAILPLPAPLAQRPGAVFTPVAGVSPLLRILEGLRPCAEILVAAAAELVPSVCEAVRALGAESGKSPQVVLADPSAGRAQCVAAALTAIDGDVPILLHDIDWPVVPPALTDRVVDALVGGASAVFPVLPVTDSVKAVDALETVTATLDRAELRSVQYPRGYAMATLTELLAGDRVGTFDDLALTLTAGLSVTLVDGDDEAVSAELPRDADYLSAVLRASQHLSGR